MNILIENAESLEYLTADNQWSKKAADGKNFGGVKAAQAIAKKELIGKFNIVWFMEETKQFINMEHGRGAAPASGLKGDGAFCPRINSGSGDNWFLTTALILTFSPGRRDSGSSSLVFHTAFAQIQHFPLDSDF